MRAKLRFVVDLRDGYRQRARWIEEQTRRGVKIHGSRLPRARRAIEMLDSIIADYSGGISDETIPLADDIEPEPERIEP